MDVVRCANVDHVYRLVGEQVVKRAISAINTQGVAVVLAAVGGAGKHSLNRDALAAERFEVGLAHKANTNDGGAKFGHKFDKVTRSREQSLTSRARRESAQRKAVERREHRKPQSARSQDKEG